MPSAVPPLQEVIRARNKSRRHDCFHVGATEYRLTHFAEDSAWDVWTSTEGDVVVDKRDAKGLTRPQLTRNEGYLMVSIARAAPRASDQYLRRRVHIMVASTFLEPAPGKAWVGHKNDVPDDNRLANLEYVSPEDNRAQKTLNDEDGEDGVAASKVRKLPVSLQLVRELQRVTGTKGQALVALVEELIKKAIKEGGGA
jgi:hypothetical protein